MEGDITEFFLVLLIGELLAILAAIPCTMIAHRLMMSPIRRRTYMEIASAPFQFSIADIIALVTLIAVLLGIGAAVDPSPSNIVVGAVLVPLIWWRGIKRLNAAEIEATWPRFAALAVCFPLVWAVDFAVVYVAITFPLCLGAISTFVVWLQVFGGVLIAGCCARLFLELICARPTAPKPEGPFPRHAGRIASPRRLASSELE